MIPGHDHITVCICTYKRPQMLAHLLRKIQEQQTAQLFTCSIVVVDNDHDESARIIVNSFAEESPIQIKYYCEPEQNIALARNKAVLNAKGDLLALIDDDEYPENNWLLTMYKAIHRYKAHGVLGPVKPYFEEQPPRWVIKGKFYEKPGHKKHCTGSVLKWWDTRTSNVLLRSDIFSESERLFNPALGRGGEDKEFFSRMIEKGYMFVWCDEAHVIEIIPPSRCKRSFMLKRALLRGKVSLLYPSSGFISNCKSVVAIFLYTLALPFLFFAGHHIFMRYLTKCFDHIGRLLGVYGFDVIKEKYVMK